MSDHGLCFACGMTAAHDACRGCVEVRGDVELLRNRIGRLRPWCSEEEVERGVGIVLQSLDYPPTPPGTVINVPPEPVVIDPASVALVWAERRPPVRAAAASRRVESGFVADTITPSEVVVHGVTRAAMLAIQRIEHEQITDRIWSAGRDLSYNFRDISSDRPARLPSRKVYKRKS